MTSLKSVLAEPLSNGRSVPSRPGGFPVLRLTAIKNGSIDAGEHKPGDWTAQEAERWVAKAGDFLLSRGNGSLKLLGAGGLVRERPRVDVAFPDTMIRVTVDQSIVSPEYLTLVWQSPGVRRQIETNARTTAGIYKINQTHVGQVRLPLPPIGEQRQIVEIIEDHLSRLEAGVGYIDKILLRASLMRRSAWEQRFASGSKLVPIASLVQKTEAGKSVGGAAPPARPGRWGIIKVSAMTWGEFRPQENKEIPDALADERFRIRLGDLLVSRANTSELVGASVLVQVPPERLLLSDKSVRVVPRSEVLAEWLWRALSAPSTRTQMSAKATGTKDSMRNISQQALLHIMVPDPSERDQAADIQWARELDMGVTRLQDQLGAQRGRASSLRRAVLAAAFSGRLTGAASDGDLIEETAETLEGER